MNKQYWGILSMQSGAYRVLCEDGKSYADDVKHAKVFNTKEEAETFALQIKTPTIVQVLVGAEPRSSLSLPHPDFFESGNEYMTLEELIEQISSDDHTKYFTPVDKIEGGQEMTGGSVTDPYTGQISGREFIFAFSKILKDDDLQTLRDMLSQDTRYMAAGYVIKRLGFTAYGVLTLRTKR